MSAEDVTGDIPTDQIQATQEIEESLELDVEEDDQLDEVDEAAEATLSKGQEIAQKIAQQLPFLQKFIQAKKKPGATTKTAKEQTLEEAEEEEDVTQKSKGVVFVEKNLPFLAPVLSKFNKSKASAPTGEEDGDEDEDDEEETPKRRLTIIHAIIIIGVAYLAYDELMAPKEPEVSEVKTPPSAKTGRPEAPAKDTPKEEIPVAETPGTETPVAETPEEETPVAETPEEETPEEETPEEETPVAETPETEIPAADPPTADSVADEESGDGEFIMPDQDLSATEKTGDTKKAADELDELFSEENIVGQDTDTGLEAPETKIPEETETPESSVNAPAQDDPVVADSTEEPEIAEPSEGTVADITERESDELQLDNSLIDQVLETEGGEEITEAILKQLEKGAKERRKKNVAGQAVEPTDPPAYLSLGRALVYNCLGRHWACVDIRSFQQCADNYAWNLKQSLEIECYPNEVYQSDLDCASMQQYKIDMAAPTDFCGKN